MKRLALATLMLITVTVPAAAEFPADLTQGIGKAGGEGEREWQTRMTDLVIARHRGRPAEEVQAIQDDVRKIAEDIRDDRIELLSRSGDHKGVKRLTEADCNPKPYTTEEWHKLLTRWGKPDGKLKRTKLVVEEYATSFEVWERNLRRMQSVLLESEPDFEAKYVTPYRGPAGTNNQHDWVSLRADLSIAIAGNRPAEEIRAIREAIAETKRNIGSENERYQRHRLRAIFELGPGTWAERVWQALQTDITEETITAEFRNDVDERLARIEAALAKLGEDPTGPKYVHIPEPGTPNEMLGSLTRTNGGPDVGLPLPRPYADRLTGDQLRGIVVQEDNIRKLREFIK